MRYKKVYLPLGVAKALVMLDLDYFGVSVQPGEVHNGCGYAAAARITAECERQFEKDRDACQSTIYRMQLKQDYLKLDS